MNNVNDLINFAKKKKKNVEYNTENFKKNIGIDIVDEFIKDGIQIIKLYEIVIATLEAYRDYDIWCVKNGMALSETHLNKILEGLEKDE